MFSVTSPISFNQFGNRENCSKNAEITFLVKLSIELNIEGNVWYGRSLMCILTQAHLKQGYRVA